MRPPSHQLRGCPATDRAHAKRRTRSAGSCQREGDRGRAAPPPRAAGGPGCSIGCVACVGAASGRGRAGRRALPTMAAHKTEEFSWNSTRSASQSGGGLGVEVKDDGGQRRSRSPSGAVGRLVAAHRGGTPCRTRSPNTVVHMEHSAAHGGSRRQQTPRRWRLI